MYITRNRILSAFATVFVVVACSSNSDKTKETTATDTTTKENATRDTTTGPEKMNPEAEQLYACPMHPEITGKKDDKCSKCGMKLTVPVKKSVTPG